MSKVFVAGVAVRVSELFDYYGQPIVCARGDGAGACLRDMTGGTFGDCDEETCID
jgi:hypothetical protein